MKRSKYNEPVPNMCVCVHVYPNARGVCAHAYETCVRAVARAFLRAYLRKCTSKLIFAGPLHRLRGERVTSLPAVASNVLQDMAVKNGDPEHSEDEEACAKRVPCVKNHTTSAKQK